MPRPANAPEIVAIGLICTLAGLATRLHGLGDKPFWLDETITLRRVALPLGRMFADALSSHHLPTYFILTSWFLGLGSDEAALRLPAALFGALSCGLAAFVAGRLAGAAAAVAAGMLMAFTPIAVQYGQEARSYTLILCLVLIALHGLIGVIRGETATTPSRAPIAAWIAYIGGTLGGLLVLGVALSWFAVANLAALSLLPRRARSRWLAVQAAIALCAAPGFIAMFVAVTRAHQDFRAGMDWVPAMTWPHLRVTLASVYGLRLSSLIADRLFAQPLPWLGLAGAMLAIAGAVHLRGQPRVATTLLVCTFALPFAMAAISLVQPLFMPRYLLWSIAPGAVLAGCGMAALPGRATRAAGAIGLSAALLLNLLPYYRAETKPLWQQAAAAVMRLPGSDLLLVDDLGAIDLMDVFVSRGGSWIPASLWTADVATAACALAEGRRVWALYGRIGQADHTTPSSFSARFLTLGTPDAVRHIGLDIVLERYDPKPAATIACRPPARSG